MLAQKSAPTPTMETAKMTNDDDGEVMHLAGFGWCEVTRTDDPSLLLVRLPDGQCVRIGEKAIDGLRVETTT